MANIKKRKKMTMRTDEEKLEILRTVNERVAGGQKKTQALAEVGIGNSSFNQWQKKLMGGGPDGLVVYGKDDGSRPRPQRITDVQVISHLVGRVSERTLQLVLREMAQ